MKILMDRHELPGTRMLLITTHLSHVIASHLLHVIVMPTFFQALNTKTTKLKLKKKSCFASHLIFHRFSPITVV